MDYRTRLLRRLFAIGRKQGLAADDLRGIAATAKFGDSLAKLSTAQLVALIDRLESKKPPQERSYAAAPAVRARYDRNSGYLPWEKGQAPRRELVPQFGKISRLLWAGGYTWNYAHGMAREMFGVDSLHWLTPHNLHALTAALATHLQRRGRKN